MQPSDSNADTSNLSQRKIRKLKAKERNDAMMKAKERDDAKRSLFYNSYNCQQNWSLPDSVIYYITKNPSRSKAYQKMVQSCKHFFIKNPILVVSKISYEFDYDKHEYCTLYNDRTRVNLKRISSKIWITDRINIIKSDDPFYFAEIIPKLYKSDAKRIELDGHKLSYKNFVFLASKCEDFIANELSVFNEDGSNVTLENIIKVMPQLKAFNYFFSSDLSLNKKNKQDYLKDLSKILTSKTVQELMKMPHFLNLELLELMGVPELPDIEVFYEYIKTNKKTKMWICFTHLISKAYDSRLQKIVDDIITTKNHKYRIPYLWFDRNNKSSAKMLSDLFYRSSK